MVLRAPRGGRYSLRGDRIGFRGLVSDPFLVPDTGAVSVELVMPDQPVVLTELKVTERSRCVPDPTTAAATAELWSEIRKALDATSIAKSSGLTFTMVTYRRELSENLVTKSEPADTIETSAPRPFYASSGEELEQRGYVVKGEEGYVYFGPDDDVLLSQAFLRTHCFTVNRRTDRGARHVGFGSSPPRTGESRTFADRCGSTPLLESSRRSSSGSRGSRPSSPATGATAGWSSPSSRKAGGSSAAGSSVVPWSTRFESSRRA